MRKLSISVFLITTAFQLTWKLVLCNLYLRYNVGVLFFSQCREIFTVSTGVWVDVCDPRHRLVFLSFGRWPFVKCGSTGSRFLTHVDNDRQTENLTPVGDAMRENIFFFKKIHKNIFLQKDIHKQRHTYFFSKSDTKTCHCFKNVRKNMPYK